MNSVFIMSPTGPSATERSQASPAGHADVIRPSSAGSPRFAGSTCFRLKEHCFRSPNVRQATPPESPTALQQAQPRPLLKSASSRGVSVAARTPVLPPTSLEPTPEEHTSVEQLRQHLHRFLADQHIVAPRDVLSDQRLLRYVRYIDAPAEECERMVLLRVHLRMDAIYDHVRAGITFPAEREMADIWEHNLFGVPIADRDGRPVFIATIGGLSRTQTLFERVDREDVRTYLHHCLEQLNQRVTEASEQSQQVLSWTYVLDLSGFSIWQAAGSDASRSFFMQIGDEVNRLAVPYQIARVLLVHVPQQWQFVWNIAKRILPEKVQRKVFMCSNLGDLEAFIDHDLVPERYGGACADSFAFVSRIERGGSSGTLGGSASTPSSAATSTQNLRANGGGGRSSPLSALSRGFRRSPSPRRLVPGARGSRTPPPSWPT